MKQPCIDLVVVNWNSGEQLLELVESIKKYHCGLISSLVIVDNASTDDSLRKVGALDDLLFDVRIIKSAVNQGFAVACNQGAKFGRGKYLLFLNPDARLFANSMKGPHYLLGSEKSTNVGIVGIQLLDETDRVSRSCARFPSAVGLVLHAIGIDRLFPRLGHSMADWDHSQTRAVDHVIGAFFFVRRRLFDALGGFDERFFVYLEDLDFSYRAHQAGWSSVYLADSQAFHAGGGTSNQVKAQRLFFSLRSRLLYAFKHFPVAPAMLVLLATTLVEPLSRSALALMRCSSLQLKENWEAYGMLWSWLCRRTFHFID